MSLGDSGKDDPTDGVWMRDEIDSPCQKICMIHPGAKLCVGCNRSAAEIASWSRYSAEERARITAELPSRASAFTAPDARPSRRRGRGGRGRGTIAGEGENA
ncbi:MAG: DUF1289 domain-containing protein [Pseudomonadota bacterium]